MLLCLSLTLHKSVFKQSPCYILIPCGLHVIDITPVFTSFYRHHTSLYLISMSLPESPDVLGGTWAGSPDREKRPRERFSLCELSLGEQTLVGIEIDGWCWGLSMMTRCVHALLDSIVHWLKSMRTTDWSSVLDWKGYSSLFIFYASSQLSSWTTQCTSINVH